MRWEEFKQAAPELAEEQCPDRRERYCAALERKIDWRPEEPYHFFAVDIAAVAGLKACEHMSDMEGKV